MTVTVGITSTGRGGRITVVKLWAKNKIRLAASLPGGKNSPSKPVSPGEIKKQEAHAGTDGHQHQCLLDGEAVSGHGRWREVPGT